MLFNSENFENPPGQIGAEWLIEAAGCDAASLRDIATLRRIFDLIIADLELKTVGRGLWHKFGGEGGVTGLVMLTESHLACHTYPEYEMATFNLYCCRTRPEWDWEGVLRRYLGAGSVSIRKITRGNPNSDIPNPKSKIVGGNI